MIADVLKAQFRYNWSVIRRNTAGISHEESLVQPVAAGNCMNWILGHILVNRNSVLRLLRVSPIEIPEHERYQRGSSALSRTTPVRSLQSILKDIGTTQYMIDAELSSRSDSDLAARVDHGDDPIAMLLAGLSFHESYHAGQVGLLRRLIGKDGAIE
jgi:uncharacterized damage-inducible protein DinB